MVAAQHTLHIGKIGADHRRNPHVEPVPANSGEPRDQVYSTWSLLRLAVIFHWHYGMLHGKFKGRRKEE